MNERISFHEVGEKLVICVDFSFCEEKDFEAILKTLPQVFAEKALMYPGQLYALSNLFQADSNTRINRLLNDHAKAMKRYTNAQIIYGVSAFKKVLNKMLNRVSQSELTILETKAEAFDFIKADELLAA